MRVHAMLCVSQVVEVRLNFPKRPMLHYALLHMIAWRCIVWHGMLTHACALGCRSFVHSGV